MRNWRRAPPKEHSRPRRIYRIRAKADAAVGSDLAVEASCCQPVSFVLRRYSQRMTSLRPREDGLRPAPAVAQRPPFVHVPV